MSSQKGISWHRLSREEALSRLDSEEQPGLAENEASARLTHYGRNEITRSGQRGPWRLLLAQFTDFMILVLIAAAVISGYVGDVTDTVVILVIVVLNAVIGFIQDYRAERALQALRKMAAAQARVRRDGRVVEIPSTQLVPGDIVLLEAGNIVPADLRLLDAVQLQINEAPLTGESMAAEKSTEAISGNGESIGDRHNMAYKGCMVDHGRGAGVCVATGMQTEFGRIAALLQTGEENRTPLQHRLARFGRHLSLVVLAICALIFGIGLLRGEPVGLMFLTAISLAVAAIPEALPAVVTISLALGAKRMVASNALIRRLPAVEALGSVTVICSDKTGTLTQNRMSLKAIYANGKLIDNAQPDHPAWHWLGAPLALSNDVEKVGEVVTGDPTELSMVEAALDAGYDKFELMRDLPRVDEISFDSVRKRMTTLHRDGDAYVSYTKGAPEAVLGLCSEQMSESGPVSMDLAAAQKAADTLAEQGYRVLTIAERRWQKKPENFGQAEESGSLCLLALVGLIDPPRPEAREAVETCLQTGITPVMITGDHPATALAVARDVGILGEDGDAVSGSKLGRLTDEELKQIVLTKRVYARVDPSQKIRIVEALQSHGQFVAMTGDGVNDAPALKRADVGVAMGKIGTEVAREASDMVLLDDNFSTIVTAVREGRRIFDNIRKFIKYTMTSNAGEILTLLLAPFLGMPIPLLPIHILWINLVTDGLPGLALSVEPEERNVMRRPPRPADESIFAHGMWQHMVWVGLLIAGLSLFSIAWADQTGSPNWQTMVFTTLTLSQLFHVLVIRSEMDSLFTIGIGSNRPLLATLLFTVVLQMAVIYLPIAQSIFHTAPLTVSELGLCFLLASTVLVAVEVEKWLVRKGWIYRSAGVTTTA